MDKPDGILLHGNTLYITNEAGNHALIVYESGTLRYLDGASRAEGLASAAQSSLFQPSGIRRDVRLLSTA